jgi:hypothetical protein
MEKLRFGRHDRFARRFGKQAEIKVSAAGWGEIPTLKLCILYTIDRRLVNGDVG